MHMHNAHLCIHHAITLAGKRITFLFDARVYTVTAAVVSVSPCCLEDKPVFYDLIVLGPTRLYIRVSQKKHFFRLCKLIN